MGERSGDGAEIAFNKTADTGTLTETQHADLPVDDDSLVDGWRETDRYALVREIARGGGGRISVEMDKKLKRRIAIKRPLDRDGGRRLEREAMVMARLEHPSIVPVHDAGHDRDGTPFYAMKLVDGPNLSERITDAKTFAGRLGLLRIVGAVADAMAYAHARGVIHRDLKPANVVVGEFGEVAVIDWGLAKAIADGERPADTATTSAEITIDGAVVGTPAYMAPEQATGSDVDARADVYALGAMLYQVLTGELPYGRGPPGEQLAKLAGGPPAAVDEREPRVPRELAAIVGKAMARDPLARYPTARELADDLHRYQDGRLVAAHRYSVWMRARRWLRRRRFVIAAVVAAMAVGAAGFLAVRRESAVLVASCDGARERLAGVWDGARRDRAADRFVATKAPSAATTWPRVAATLDRYGESWIAMQNEACRATRVDGRQSEALLDLRTACLERRRAELDALADQLEHADDGVVQHAVEAALAVEPLADCADSQRLLGKHGPRVIDPEWPGRLAKLKALFDVGRWRDATELATQLTHDADARADTGIRAEAWAWLGRLQSELGEVKAAEPTLKVALRLAASVGDDVQAAGIVEDLVYVLDADKGRQGEALLAADMGEAIVVRIPDGDRQRASLLLARSDVLGNLSRVEDAHVALVEALTLLEHGASDDIALGRVLARMASNRRDAGVYDEARVDFDKALAIFERQLGADHPKVAQVLNNKAGLARLVGDNNESLADLRRAIEIKQLVFGPDSTSLANSIGNLGNALYDIGRYDEAAKAHERAVEILTAALGPDHQDTARVLGDLGNTRRAQGHLDEAMAIHQRALRIDLKIYGAESTQVATDHANIGAVLLDRGDPTAADVEAKLAIAIRGRILGPDHPDVLADRVTHARALAAAGNCGDAITELNGVMPALEKATSAALIVPLTVLAACEVERGHARDALIPAERAVTLARGSDARSAIDPAKLAIARFELARALWDSGSDHARAGELAAAAEQALASPASTRDRARVVAWRSQRRR